MNNEFIFDITPEELPFHEDDLGDHEPRIVEYMVKKIKEQNAMFVVNPKRFKKAINVAVALIKAVKNNCSEVQCELSYDAIIGKDMCLKIVGDFLCFDKDAIAELRKEDDIIGGIDVSGTIDGKGEMNITFKDVRVRLLI